MNSNAHIFFDRKSPKNSLIPIFRYFEICSYDFIMYACFTYAATSSTLRIRNRSVGPSCLGAGLSKCKCEARSNFKLRGPLQNKTNPYYILLVP